MVDTITSRARELSLIMVRDCTQPSLPPKPKYRWDNATAAQRAIWLDMAKADHRKCQLMNGEISYFEYFTALH